MNSPPFNLIAHGFMLSVGFDYQHIPQRMARRLTPGGAPYHDTAPAYDLYVCLEFLVTIDEDGAASHHVRGKP